MDTKALNLSRTDRINRAAAGGALIALTLLSGGTLGYLALLPIAAIVPLMTAVLGYCPLYALARLDTLHTSDGPATPGTVPVCASCNPA